MAESDANAGAPAVGALEQHLITGGDYLRRGRTEEARDEFLAALDIDPDNGKALGLLGLAYFRLSDFDAALPVYLTLVALNPNDASFWLNLGLVHLKLNDAESAIAELTRSRELDPSQSRAVSYLGLAYARNGEYAEAYLAFLQAGQTELASEMEQYLTAEQRRAIAAQVAQPAPPSEETAPVPATTDTHGAAVADADAAVGEVANAGQPTASASHAQSAAEDFAERRTGVTEEVDLDDLVDVSEEEGVAVIHARAPSQSPAAEPAAEPAGEPAGSEDFEDVEDESISPSSSGPIITPRRHRRSGSAPALRDAQADAIPRVSPDSALGPGAISAAVAQAVPSAAATAGAARVGLGNRAPMSLSEFATAKLIRPEEGDHAFEISASGVLIIRVKDRVYARTEGVDVTGGELAYEVASRHVRGSSTGEDFSADGRPLFIVTGRGHLIAGGLGEHFTAVTLDDDILYMREDLVFAFEDRVSWENGKVPGSGGAIRMVQFRGEGSVVFRTKKPLLAIKLAPERMLHIDARVMAGWIGRVVPRGVTPIGGGNKSTLFVECTGEGVVLVEESGRRSSDADTAGAKGGA